MVDVDRRRAQVENQIYIFEDDANMCGFVCGRRESTCDRGEENPPRHRDPPLLTTPRIHYGAKMKEQNIISSERAMTTKKNRIDAACSCYRNMYVGGVV